MHCGREFGAVDLSGVKGMTEVIWENGVPCGAPRPRYAGTLSVSFSRTARRRPRAPRGPARGQVCRSRLGTPDRRPTARFRAKWPRQFLADAAWGEPGVVNARRWEEDVQYQAVHGSSQRGMGERPQIAWLLVYGERATVVGAGRPSCAVHLGLKPGASECRAT